MPIGLHVGLRERLHGGISLGLWRIVFWGWGIVIMMCFVRLPRCVECLIDCFIGLVVMWMLLLICYSFVVGCGAFVGDGLFGVLQISHQSTTTSILF